MDVNECSYERSYDGRKNRLPERVDVRARLERRRRWSSAAKLAIIRETLMSGSTAQAVADRHEICTSLIYTWRKQMLRAAMASFAAVEIKPDVQMALPGSVEPAAVPPAAPEPSAPEPSAPPPSAASSNAMPGGIEVELPSGVRLRFGSDVDGPALQRILTALAAP